MLAEQRRGARDPSRRLRELDRQAEHPRAAVCGSAAISAMELIGPQGTPSASSAASHSRAGRVFSRSFMSATSSGRCAIRSAFVLKRGSLAHSGAPRTRVTRCQFAWFAPPMVIQPSAARNAW